MYNIELHNFFARTGPAAPQLAHRAVPELSEDDKDLIIDWLDYLFVASDDTDEVDRALNKIIARNRRARPGAKTIPILTAPNGTGKSTFMLEWGRKYYADHFTGTQLDPFTVPTLEEDGLIIEECPIVYLNVDGNMGAADLNKAICAFFRLGTYGTKAEVGERAGHALRTHRVRILIVDDAHFLNTRKILGRELLDHIKNQNTELGVVGATLILVGANLEGGPILEDPQITCRSRTLAFHDYGTTDAAGMAACQRSLKRIEHTLRQHIPGIREDSLSRVLAGRITERVGGRHGDMAGLVREAYKCLLEDEGATWLSKQHINDADVPDRIRKREQQQAAPRKKRHSLRKISTM